MKLVRNSLLFALLLLGHLTGFSQQDIIVQPDSAYRGQQLQVLFSGVNVDFTQGSGIQLYFAQGSNAILYPQVFNVQASNVATGTFDIPFYADCGSYSLRSTLGHDFPNKFTVNCNDDIIVQPDSANRGQRLQVLFSGVNVDFNQATNIQLYFAQGSTLIFPEVFNVQASDVASGIFEIPVDAECGSYSLLSTYGHNYPDKFTIDCSAQIAGNVYFDTDGSGFRDINESGVEGVTVVIHPALGNDIITQTDVSGNYSALVSLGAYGVSIVLPQYHQLSSATTSYNVNLTSINNVASGNDFGIEYNGLHNDLEVSLAATNAISGRPANYWVNCHNAGTASQNTTLVVSLDNNLSFISASVPPSTSSGNSYTWNGIILQPGESTNILLEVLVDVLPQNSVLTSSAQITSAATDETSDNNADTLVQNVLSSYDPNDKLVKPEGVTAEKLVLKNQYLTYTIRFQNTGNYQAFNIHITDALDENLDYATLQVISSSHSVEYELKNGELNFFFNNILLPDSGTDLSGSQGYVQYRILPKSGLPDNTIVENSADIYFDFNPAVITNTTSSKLVDSIPTSISTPALENGFVRIYPNPVEGDNAFTIEISKNIPLNSIDFISIFTPDGKKIYQTSTIKSHYFIVTEISDYYGIAFIQLQSKDNAYFSKLVKF